MKNFIKYVSIFLISTILLLIFYPQSKASDYCTRESTVTADSLTKISDNIYLSKDGKIYQKIDCSIADRNINIDVAPAKNVYNAQIIQEQHINANNYGDEQAYGMELSTNQNIDTSENSNASSSNYSYSFLNNEFQWNHNNNYINNFTPPPIEISPVYDSKFFEIDRKLTVDELISLNKYLLKQINLKLSAKYTSNYSLIENNDSMLRAKVENINRQITNNTWETLELTITPIIVNSQRIDIIVSAILYIQSGIQVSVSPPKSGFKVSNDYSALEDYVGKLIVYLKNEIPSFKFTLKSKDSGLEKGNQRRHSKVITNITKTVI